MWLELQPYSDATNDINLRITLDILKVDFFQRNIIKEIFTDLNVHEPLQEVARTIDFMIQTHVSMKSRRSLSWQYQCKKPRRS